MSKLEEIEAAADALPPDDQRQLLLFLATRLRAHGIKPAEPRTFAAETMKSWIAEDEADLRRFREGK